MEEKMKRVGLVVSFVLFPIFIFAQQNNWKIFNVNNTGYPYAVVSDLLLDVNHNVWIGGKFGLTKFDGVHWKNQNQSNSDIPFRSINIIFERNEKLYFSGSDTVRTALNTIENEERFATYDNGIWTSYNLKPTFAVDNNNIILDMVVDNSGNIFCTSTTPFVNNFYQIFSDSVHQIINPNEQYWHGEVLEQANDGGIWIGRNGDISGIYKYENGRIDSVYFPIPADTINGIVDIKEDSNGNLWLLGNDRLVKFTNGSFQVFKNFPVGYPNPSNYYFTNTNLQIDSDNNLWFGSALNGLYKFNSQTLQWSRFDVANPFIASTETTNDNIKRVKLLANNQIYLQGNLALYLFDGNSIVKRWGTDNTGISGNNISNIFIDAHKHIWTSDLNNGFAMYNGDKWSTYSTMDIFNRRVLTLHDICVTPSGDIWLADDSLRYFTNNSWHSTSSPSTYNSYTSVAYDQNNKIWIGSDYGGLFEYENGNFTHYSNSEIMGSRVNKIFVDKNNNKWIGFTNSGISKFDGTNWTHFNSNDGLSGDQILDIDEDNAGNIWVAVYTGGVAKYDGNVWTSFTTANSGIPTNNTKVIACDNNSAIWIGTDDSGLVKFDGGNWTIFNSNNSPLPARMITEITVDNNNNKWVGVNGDANNSGLFIYNENGVIVDVKDNSRKSEIPARFVMSQNYPNPFNPSTTIQFALPKAGMVNLKVYNILGEEVAELINREMNAGSQSINFDASHLSSGLYFYRISAGTSTSSATEFVDVKKMLLLK